MHPTARDGFNDGAIYERGRPGYPAATTGAIGIGPDTKVVDLGCGTGKYTRVLRDAGADVIGVEPLSAMAEVFAKLLPGVPIVSGTAEAIPLPDGCADVVTCASAFHWFDHERALPEIARVLRPHGRLAIVWNRRDRFDGWSAGLWSIVERHRHQTPGYRSGAWRAAVEASPHFGPLSEHTFEHVQTLDIDGLLARIASISFIETLPPGQRDAVMAEAESFLQTHPDTKDLTVYELPYKTVAYVTTAQ